MLDFTDCQIDGEALMCLTERACEELIPVMGHRMKFLRLLTSLREKKSEACCVPEPITSDLPTASCSGDMEVVQVEVHESVSGNDGLKKHPQQSRYAIIYLLLYKMQMSFICEDFFWM